jgi:hypothetical protein
MSTGMKSGKVFDEKVNELYAADAGIADGMWCINSDDANIPMSPEEPVFEYILPSSVNGKSVTVSITNIDELTYKVLSTAADPLSAHSTTIESYMTILNFGVFTTNALTSPTSIVTKPGDVINGDVHGPASGLDLKGTINGLINTAPVKGWPNSHAMSAFFGRQVNKSDPYPSDTISLDGTFTIPSLYRVGDLTILPSSDNSVGILEGTMYVTGNLSFPQSGTKNYTIDLNGQTIYVRGAIDFPSYRCNVKGPGSIIAIGDINFQPGISSDGFTFVMSINGKVSMNPNGTFYGSIAGNTIMNIQPNCTITNTSPVPNLNIPDQNSVGAIITWKIR